MTETQTRTRPVLPNQAEDMKAAYPFPDGGPIALVPCATCQAQRGEKCQTSSGKPVRGTFHVARFNTYRAAWNGRVMRMVLCVDDERFDLTRGDILLCVAYRYDAKVTVLRREADDFDPSCNQYNHDVRLIEFTDLAERDVR